ncbi:uncharacterized protein LOC125679667 isoform X2 [Ostrea edulis]|uniref:uncharacterized protein LOC125679667 isoform X2 n=1 Tax=Ostrea edulis TaxID=37623 RepID=UPI0024AF2229|nr:uncharacterized protein LOC125679667 isoform X2 [Ostrea edulis]XP_056013082.1 uncharacterized protein LOC125679667 isoform X2 [Ostrea edulis]
MNEFRTQTLQLLFRNEIDFLCNSLDFLILKAYLIKHNIVPRSKMKSIEHFKVKFQQIESLVKCLIEERPQKIFPFMEILKNESLGYKFVYDYLIAKFGAASIPGVQTISKTIPGSQRRVFELSFRHFLKRLLHRNDLGAFEQRRQEVISAWKQCTFAQKSLLADRYCMVLDAEVERRLVKVDRTLVDSDIFTEILKCAPFTANPNLHIMLYLARYSYALFVGGKSYEEVLSYIDQARTHIADIEPCRETGIVLYILFNMKSVSYEKHPTEKVKMELLDIVQQAIDHFSNEDEVISEDFRRILLIKKAMLYLGLGIFGQNNTNLIISDEDIANARCCLRKVREQKMWERMETRWEMFYYLCKVKYLQLTDADNKHIETQISLTKKARSCSIQGEYREERQNIDAMLEYLLEVQQTILKNVHVASVK